MRKDLAIVKSVFSSWVLGERAFPPLSLLPHNRIRFKEKVMSPVAVAIFESVCRF